MKRCFLIFSLALLTSATGVYSSEEVEKKPPIMDGNDETSKGGSIKEVAKIAGLLYVEQQNDGANSQNKGETFQLRSHNENGGEVQSDNEENGNGPIKLNESRDHEESPHSKNDKDIVVSGKIHDSKEDDVSDKTNDNKDDVAGKTKDNKEENVSDKIKDNKDDIAGKTKRNTEDDIAVKAKDNKEVDVSDKTKDNKDYVAGKTNGNKEDDIADKTKGNKDDDVGTKTNDNEEDDVAKTKDNEDDCVARKTKDNKEDDVAGKRKDNTPQADAGMNSTKTGNDKIKGGKEGLVFHFPEKYVKHSSRYRSRSSRILKKKVAPQYCSSSDAIIRQEDIQEGQLIAPLARTQ